MEWLVPVGLRVIVANVATPTLIKHISGQHARTKRFFLQFLFCVLIAIPASILLGQFVLDRVMLLLVFVGFINGLAAYCQWRAVDLSLSRTALFTWGDNVIAMLLGYFLLAEGTFITTQIGIGVMLALGAAVLSAHHKSQQEKKKEQEAGSHTEDVSSFAIYKYIAAYSIIWGFAAFFMRTFALEDIAVGQFLSGWYFGAMLAALLLLVLHKDKSKSQERDDPLTLQDVLLVFLLSVGVVSALGLAYWAYMVAPIVVVNPIFLISAMVFPAFIGLFGFSERKELDKREWGYYGLGIVGAFFIVLGF